MGATPATATDVRLAEVLAALSLATDVGNGFPLEKSLRTALIAASMADALELGREQAAEVYYVALLRSIGCSAFAHEVAAAFGGDDRGFRDPAAAEPYFELYDPAVVLHGFPPGVETVGGLRAAYGEIWAALPGGRIHLDDVIAAGDRVACRVRITGAHTGGDLLGVPATGTDVEIHGQTILRFEDGRCVERWQSMDALGLLQQLGALPAAA